MPDYQKILDRCTQSAALTRKVFDEKLMYHAAQRDKLDREMDKRLQPYKHITRGFGSAWVNMLKSQYIAHRVYKSGGLIHKYLNHSLVKNLPREEQDFLTQQSQNPWRFSFSMAIGNPEQDFYEMMDMCTGETYLVYSTGMTDILRSNQVRMWFNLIGYNGACWQTFGPIAHYQSFDPDDLFFFATELDDSIQDESDMQASIEANPVPYMMLLEGATVPLVHHQENELVKAIGWIEDVPASFDPNAVGDSCQHNDGVYKIEIEGWAGPPHFAAIYYDEPQRLIQVLAMSDPGYDKLVELLAAKGFGKVEADVRVHPSMLITAKKILKREVELDEYEVLFEQPKNPLHAAEVGKVNELFGLALPDINAGKEPDVKKLAKQTGLDEEFVREALDQVIEKLGSMRRRG